jgi:hypothetical protein
VNNGGEVKRFSRHDQLVALAKGLHELKVVFLGHITGGWPSNRNNAPLRLNVPPESHRPNAPLASEEKIHPPFFFL